LVATTGAADGAATVAIAGANDVAGAEMGTATGFLEIKEKFPTVGIVGSSNTGLTPATFLMTVGIAEGESDANEGVGVGLASFCFCLSLSSEFKSV
jgi:hypothetical protein